MRSRTVALTLAIAFLLAGCGEDGDGPTPAASSAATTATTPAATAEPEESESAGAATGKLVVAEGVSGRGFTYRLPEGRWMLSNGGESAARYTRFGHTGIDHGALAFGGISLSELANLALDLYAWPPSAEIERVEDRTIAGSEWYVVEATDPDRGFEYRVGTVRDADNSHELIFAFPKDSPQAREMIESVLATVEWR